MRRGLSGAKFNDAVADVTATTSRNLPVTAATDS